MSEFPIYAQVAGLITLAAAGKLGCAMNSGGRGSEAHGPGHWDVCRRYTRRSSRREQVRRRLKEHTKQMLRSDRPNPLRSLVASMMQILARPQLACCYGTQAFLSAFGPLAHQKIALTFLDSGCSTFPTFVSQREASINC